MKNTGTLKVVAQGDREIVMTRVFDAPRDLVFDALTKPELLKRWFGPHGWTLDRMRNRPSRRRRVALLLARPDGRTMGMRGIYREIARPERIQYTERSTSSPSTAAR